MVCSRCDAENEASTRFCEKCGTSRSDDGFRDQERQAIYESEKSHITERDVSGVAWPCSAGNSELRRSGGTEGLSLRVARASHCTLQALPLTDYPRSAVGRPSRADPHLYGVATIGHTSCTSLDEGR
jgi:hypothetical protein